MILSHSVRRRSAIACIHWCEEWDLQQRDTEKGTRNLCKCYARTRIELHLMNFSSFGYKVMTDLNISDPGLDFGDFFILGIRHDTEALQQTSR